MSEPAQDAAGRASARSVPAGFVPYRRPSPYLDLIGPIFEADDPELLVVGMAVHRKHTNTRGFVHAGVLVSLADTVLGHTILRRFPESAPIVTVSLTTDFIGSAYQGSWLQGTAKVTRQGSRVSFAHAVFVVEERTIMTASGIFATQPRE